MSRLRRGDVLHGYCGGLFGRDSYGPKEVIARGPDWAVVRDTDEDHLELYDGDPCILEQYRDGSTSEEDDIYGGF